MEYKYYRVRKGSEAHKVIADTDESLNKFREHILAMCKKYGLYDVLSYNSDGYIAVVYFKDNTADMKIWKQEDKKLYTKEDGTKQGYSPRKNRKAGREIDKDLRSVKRPTGYDLCESLFGQSYFVVGLAFASCCLERYNDDKDILVGVADTDEAEPVVKGLKLLKMSEYYKIIEKAEENA